MTNDIHAGGHTVWPNLLALAGPLVFTITALQGRAGVPFVAGALAAMAGGEFLRRFRRCVPLNPTLLMVLSPLLLVHYATIGDFRIRLASFLMLVYVFAFLEPPRKPVRNILPRRPLGATVLAFLVLGAAAGVFYANGVSLSGDEPHYLMMTQSIVEDGDLDLRNNVEKKTYHRYLPVDLRFHGGVYGTRYLSYHMPGVSFLMVPFYAVFHLLNEPLPAPLYFRLCAAVFGALFALCLYLILQRMFPGRDMRHLWFLFLILYPLLFHGIHLYPEIPAATLMMAVVLLSFFEHRNPLLAGLLLSCILWFHVKYYPAVLILGLIILAGFLKRKRYREAVLFLVFPAVNLLLLMAYTHGLYGSLSPTDIFPKQAYLSPPLLLQVKVFLAYFFDQRDGLLAYAPLLLLFLFAPLRGLKRGGTLLWIAVPYVVLHAVTTVRGAYAPAGRPLIFVSWIFMIWVAHFFLERTGAGSRSLFRLLAGLSMAVTCWLLYYPLFAYQPVFSGTTQRASTLLLFHGGSEVDLSRLFPSFLTHPPSAHPANWIWLGLLTLAAAAVHTRVISFAAGRGLRRTLSLVLFLTLATLFCYYPHVHLIAANRRTDTPVPFYNNSGNLRYVPDRGGYNLLVPGTYKLFLDPATRRSEPLVIRLSATGTVHARLSNKRRVLLRLDGEKRIDLRVPLETLGSIRVRGRTVIPLEIAASTPRTRTFLFMEIEQ